MRIGFDELLILSSAERLELFSKGPVVIGLGVGTKIIHSDDIFCDTAVLKGKRVAQWKQDAGMNRGRNRLVKAMPVTHTKQR